jgi:hypothetical protein
LISLARRRCDVLYAMLRSGTHYRHPEPSPAPLRLDNHIGTPPEQPCAPPPRSGPRRRLLRQAHHPGTVNTQSRPDGEWRLRAGRQPGGPPQ